MPRVKLSSGPEAPARTAADELSATLGPEPRRRAPEAGERRPASAAGPSEKRVTIPVDLVNEQVLIAACMGDKDTRAWLTGRAKPDAFFGKGHAQIWHGMSELVRIGLDYAPAVLSTIVPGVDLPYLQAMARAHSATPPNLRHHLERLDWDRARVEGSRGPLAELLKTLQDPTTQPDQVQSLVKKLGVAFDGYADRRYLRDPTELVRDSNADLDERVKGRAVYPFGIDGFDLYEDGDFRLLPGAAPGLMTVVTGVPGGGKSTFTANLAIALMNQGKKVLYGAWEMSDKTMLELIAAIRIGISRKKLTTGMMDPDEVAALKREKDVVAGSIRFLQMPFGRERGKTKVDNDRNLDLIHGYVADAGCDVAVFDLWKRCLRFTDPDDEEQALIRQQAILEETKVHGILVQQQRAKDVEQRKDKRPTRESIKGSGAWFEVPDNIFGVHRPALWKRIDDDTLEVCILKQRYGKWPIAVGFDWSAEMGTIARGRSIVYDAPDDDPGAEFGAVENYGKRGRS